MKNPTKIKLSVIVAALALASVPVARADIYTVSNDNVNVSTWDPVGGSAPFYQTIANFSSGTSAQGAPGATPPATVSVLSETFTITNGAGGLTSISATSNYMLNAVGILAGGSASVMSIHLFDVTTNLTSNNGSVLNGSGATYNFGQDGDLFGNGSGLAFTNIATANSEQEFFVLDNGGVSQDSVVLSAGHTYAVEFWETGGANWYRVVPADSGGQAMGSKNSALTVARNTITSLGLAGGAPRTFVLALYGTPTTNAPTVNTSTNELPERVYTLDDFSTNGVGSNNVAGLDYYAGTNYPYVVSGNIADVWSEWFGNGSPVITFNPNQNVSGFTNSNGAMQINLTWNGPATDGYQQWLLWHGNANTYCPTNAGGTVGIGYPYYTKIEADVKFDPSSDSTTNSAGVLGVIRLGIRGVGAFGQDWANDSYTTISDNNWHHLSGTLNPSNPDSLNIADVIIGEDVNANVGGGGLTGNQVLYVDNIRITGPGGAIALPPPVVKGPVKAQPGLRIFAGSSVNTYDREDLYTVDQNQGWQNATPGAPVSYTFSLLDYNPNIGQTMVELIAPPTTPTSAGEYADYSGPNTLWMQLNPAGNGQVIALVQWKTNFPGGNPNNTVAQFTNSTAVGTWSLVFTSPTAGHVVAPGSVVLGSTSFNIADGTVGTDFPNSGTFAVFGLQPNTTAGEGAYEDWGFIAVTNVPDGNEYEDFTTESSDFADGFDPAVLFETGMAAMSSSLVIQTTNDAWWVSWNQPAVGFTLTSATNLLSNNWINPGWYSGYQDTNAPRVMPLAGPYGNNFWVLLPADDLPTASGAQNSYSATAPNPGKASTAPAPNAFFKVSTTTVSP